MLFLHLFKKLYKSFVYFFILFVFIFAVSDFFIRMPILTSISITPKIFLLMFPLMTQFAMPIASCFAPEIVIGKLFIKDEFLFFHFFKKARKKLFFMTLLFSISITFIYTPLILFWVPKSYKKGKELILKIAKEQFHQLDPNKFYVLTPELNFFFKKKFKKNDKLCFEKILMAFNDKDGERYIACATKGFLKQDTLILKNGTIQNLNTNKYHFLSFEKTEIILSNFFNKNNNNEQNKQLKFLSWNNLKKIKQYSNEAFMEYHKRIVQILWQFFFPFLGLLGIIIFARRKSNLLISVLLCGSLFLFSYINVNLTKPLYYYCYNFSVLILYLPLFILLGILYFVAHKRF